MSDGGLTVVDGTELRSVSASLPESNDGVWRVAQVLDFAESKVSASLFGLSLPKNLKSSALKRLLDSQDDVAFRSTDLDTDHASKLLVDYIYAIADELKDNPLVISILDGNTLRQFLEDEDDFAMIAENLFTDLDTTDKGKISKNEIPNALGYMGVEMGVPPISEFPLLNDILNKHGAEGEEELGQAQFAQVLQAVLQDLADALAEKLVVFVRNIKITNGSKLRKLLSNEKQLNNVIEKIFRERDNKKDVIGSIEIIRGFLEENGKELGLPPSEANEAVVLLYDAVFADLGSAKNAFKEDDEFRELVKDILEKFA
ncbi:hypothetical protein CFOL_v3_19252 [Cephalotus follicularis]|uniref:EF-hand domain-containing protein n=1 Tax=Cephalotus follicularis TaxID=3775 RepID=A0A1Q3C670_CEPFO|nr:hypothetical protein CFOL_v3_19252 [Cephalotus follicularis]